MRCSRLLIALLIATAFTLPRASMPTATAQILHGNGIELYRSEGFGYFLWWDPASWSLDEQSAEPGFHHVRMSKDATFVDFFGYAQPGITPRQCVEDVLARLADNPSIVDVAPLAPGSVTPHIFDIDDLASTELAFTVDMHFTVRLPTRPTMLIGPDLLAFADVEPTRLRVIPLASSSRGTLSATTQTYSMPGQPSPREKFSVDIVITSGNAVFSATGFRYPRSLPPRWFPAAWRPPRAGLPTFGLEN